MIKVRGYRVLVKPDPIERETESGIVLSIEGTAADNMERSGQQYGTVVGIGNTCWHEMGDPWAEIGDRILYSKHAGRLIYDKDTEEEFYIMNDTDILAVYYSEN